MLKILKIDWIYIDLEFKLKIYIPAVQPEIIDSRPLRKPKELKPVPYGFHIVETHPSNIVH